ncbi:hypothetical protein Tco_0398193 [Tanacetum coccineum]
MYPHLYFLFFFPMNECIGADLNILASTVKSGPVVTILEPRSVAQALEDPSWVDAMQAEMQQFKFQNVWILVICLKVNMLLGLSGYSKTREMPWYCVRNNARHVASRSMIGSLMYLTASRPDIMFAVSACSRNQVTPTTSNLEAVKKIFKYLKGQPKLGLWYPRESPFVLEAYSDSDYAGANKDRKSTTGGCQFLG